MRALVTGAGGFIGSHLVEHLLEHGYDVRCLVHYRGDGSCGHLDESEAKDHVQIVRGDILDGDRLKRTATGCDVIFHLAAMISIPSSYSSPDRHLAVNAGGTLNALAAARWHDCRLMMMSTSETLGTAQYTPQDELHPLSAQSVYAASKIAAEHLCLAFDKSFADSNVVIARCFNVSGARQSQRAVLPNVALQVLRGEYQVKVGTLTATRDISDVRDTVRGLWMLAESDARGDVFHIGSGSEVSVGDLVHRVAAVLGRNAVPVLSDEYVRPPRSEVQRLVCDYGKFHALTGWSPIYTLDDTIRSVAEYLMPRMGSLPEGMVR